MEAIKALVAEEANHRFKNYRPLDQARREIRVLKLEYVFTLDILTGTFVHVSLDEKPRYEALSYCWGLPGDYRTVLIEGQYVQLRTSAYDFLKILCLDDQREYVWLDALCINQGDIRERNAQVSIMSDIYSSSLRVRAWLGSQGFSHLEASYAAARGSQQNQTYIHRSEPEDLNEQLPLIFENTYWKRAWIVQECILAPELIVHLGKITLPWSVLVDTASKIQLESEYSIKNLPGSLDHKKSLLAQAAIVPRRLEKNRTQIQRQAARPMRVEALNYLSYECSDERDLLYSLRGITCGKAQLIVDYQNSVLQTIFDVIGKACLSHGHGSNFMVESHEEAYSCSSTLLYARLLLKRCKIARGDIMNHLRHSMLQSPIILLSGEDLITHELRATTWTPSDQYFRSARPTLPSTVELNSAVYRHFGVVKFTHMERGRAFRMDLHHLFMGGIQPRSAHGLLSTEELSLEQDHLIVDLKTHSLPRPRMNLKYDFQFFLILKRHQTTKGGFEFCGLALPPFVVECYCILLDGMLGTSSTDLSRAKQENILANMYNEMARVDERYLWIGLLIQILNAGGISCCKVVTKHDQADEISTHAIHISPLALFVMLQLREIEEWTLKHGRVQNLPKWEKEQWVFGATMPDFLKECLLGGTACNFPPAVCNCLDEEQG